MTNPTVSPFSDALKVYDDFWYKFVYFPTTNWQRAFNPQFFFGCNTEDMEIERYVLNEVGSYGLQLGHIIDMLNVVVKHLPEDKLDSTQQQIKNEFLNLSRNVDVAVATHRGRPIEGITQGDISHLIGELHRLKEHNKPTYDSYIAQLKNAIDVDATPTDEPL